MITNQIMKRDFFDAEIGQRTKDSFFNATDLLKFYNDSHDKQKVIAEFWSNAQTVNFTTELAKDLNIGNSLHLKTVIESDLYETKRGRYGSTYMHPYLFVKFAMWLSSEFEVKVIKWVYDNLIDFRNQAGDYYKLMCKTIYEVHSEYYDKVPSPLIYISEARYLNELVRGSCCSNQRNELNENELSLLNGLQKLNISLLEHKTPAQARKQKMRDYAEMYKIANF